MKFRKHFDYDVEKASNDVAVTCADESLTVQSDAKDADINTIVERFGLTGKMPDDPRVPRFGDFTEVFDYQSALNSVAEANENFMRLPPKLRERFNHDPQKLLEFVSDDSNMDEARKLGLLKEKVNEPVKTSGTEAGVSTASGAAPVAVKA